MITRIEGTLEAIDGSRATVASGELAYEVAVPSADVAVLLGRRGELVVFHTLHYLESQGQGSSFWPRLIGFQSAKDRKFFELITSVKGIGVRRALRALTIPFGRIAEAILMKDLALLTSLPEIGRKTAETMVLELRDKMDAFAVVSGPVAAMATKGTKTAANAAKAATAEASTPPTTMATVMDAVSVLVQLGESRMDARALIDRAIERDPDAASADQLVAAALAAKGAPR
ncbi:MAG: hypothetical protein EXS03_08220 [Phycisphaerales bacterium]|nr:hypothetical protein [Phycisphaerales bacterium]